MALFKHMRGYPRLVLACSGGWGSGEGGGGYDVLFFKMQYACLPVAVLHGRVHVVDVESTVPASRHRLLLAKVHVFCVYNLDLISSHTIPYHIISFHIISDHRIPYHLISSHLISNKSLLQ